MTTSQAKILFYSELDNYSSRVLMRIQQQVASQAKEALQEADAHGVVACSPQHLLAMRRIAYPHRQEQRDWLCATMCSMPRAGCTARRCRKRSLCCGRKIT